MATANPFKATESVLLWADDNRVNMDLIYCRSNPPEHRFLARLRPWENKPGKGVMYAAVGHGLEEAIRAAADLLASEDPQLLDFAWRGGPDGDGASKRGVGFTQLAF